MKQVGSDGVASASSLRIVFMGTAAFAVPSLRALADGRHPLVAVYTQPPRPAGRGMRPRASAVQLAAMALGLPVFTPASLKGAASRSGSRKSGGTSRLWLPTA